MIFLLGVLAFRRGWKLASIGVAALTFANLSRIIVLALLQPYPELFAWLHNLGGVFMAGVAILVWTGALYHHKRVVQPKQVVDGRLDLVGPVQQVLGT